MQITAALTSGHDTPVCANSIDLGQGPGARQTAQNCGAYPRAISCPSASRSPRWVAGGMSFIFAPCGEPR
jgi:hypothetical protein